MKLTKEQIDEIVAAAYPVPNEDANVIRARLTRAFGERVNPFEPWRGVVGSPFNFAADLYNAAAKVADGCDAEGFRNTDIDIRDVISARAALKRIVEEIRGMA